MEKWKYIESMKSNAYMVSTHGNIKSMNYNKTGKEKLMKLREDKDGYLTVSLVDKNGKSSPRKVHRLVAMAFIENPNNLPMVNHKDENKSNNHVENLEWCDSVYNNTYNDRHKRAGETARTSFLFSNTKFKSKPVLCHQNNKFYCSQTHASIELKLHDGLISKVVRGIQKSTNGYSFEYATKEMIEKFIECNRELDDEYSWMIDFLKFCDTEQGEVQ